MTPTAHIVSIVNKPFLPHILCGGSSLHKLGRGNKQYMSSGLLQRWFTLWTIDQGELQVSIDAKPSCRIEGPAALILEPGHQYTVLTQPGTDSFWIEWGIEASQLTYRGQRAHALRYSNRKEQPTLEAFFGVQIPQRLPDMLQAASSRLCQKIAGLWWRSERERLQANYLLGEWLLDLVEFYHDTETSIPLFPDVSPETQQLLSMATQQLDQHMTVTTWAQLAGCHRNALNQRMLRETGFTAKEILDHIRLDQACSQLRRGKSVEFVSQWIGFQSRTAFSRWFKKQCGTSPSLWQLSHSV